MSKTRMLTTVLTLALLAPTSGVLADGQQTLASTMDVYAFPTEGQRESLRLAPGARGSSGIKA
jgi:hypothetical protein